MACWRPDVIVSVVFSHLQCKAHGINAPKGAEFSIVDALKEGSKVGPVCLQHLRQVSMVLTA